MDKKGLYGQNEDDIITYATVIASLRVRAYNLLVFELDLNKERFHEYESRIAWNLAHEAMKIVGSVKDKAIYI